MFEPAASSNTTPFGSNNPGTASERSAGRRIRDPCLGGHPRDPAHDEARAAGRRRGRRILQRRRPPLRRRCATPPPPPLRGVEDSPPQAPPPILQPHEVGEVPSEARRRGGPRRTSPRRWTVGTTDVARRSITLPRIDGPKIGAIVAPTFVIPERRPSAAQDDVSGIHASPPIPAIRSTTRHVPPGRRRGRRILQRRRPPPSSLRDATSAPTAWGGGSPPKRRRPSSNPTKWGGGAERSEAEGGTPPGLAATTDGRHDGRGQAVRHAPAHRRPEDPTRRAPLHLRHPGTASKRSEGRRIRDPCLGAGHRAGRWRRSDRCVACTAPPFDDRGGMDPGSAPPLRSGFARDDEGENSAAPRLRHPGTASKRSAGRRIRDPCLAIRPRAPVHDEARAAAAPVAATSCAAPPPSSLRDATSAPTSWGGGRVLPAKSMPCENSVHTPAGPQQTGRS